MATDFLRTTLDRIALAIATGFGLGYLPVAPGTWGTLLGVAWYLALWKFDLVVAGTITGLVISVPTATVGERHFGKKDPGAVVVDEVAAFPIAMFGLPATVSWIAAAFVLFRIFDITKPQPARWIQCWPRGWGIVADDVIAAGYACAVLHLFRYFV